MFILDAHLDLAMNAVEWNRDLTQTVEDIRKSEIGMSDKPDRERNTVSLDAMRKGNIGICVATQIAGVKNDNNLSLCKIIVIINKTKTKIANPNRSPPSF